MITVDDRYCPKNHICPVISLCPVKAITQDGPFSAPRVDQEKCIECSRCVLACRTFQEVQSPVPQ